MSLKLKSKSLCVWVWKGEQYLSAKQWFFLLHQFTALLFIFIHSGWKRWQMVPIFFVTLASRNGKLKGLKQIDTSEGKSSSWKYRMSLRKNANNQVSQLQLESNFNFWLCGTRALSVDRWIYRSISRSVGRPAEIHILWETNVDFCCYRFLFGKLQKREDPQGSVGVLFRHVI